MFKTLRFMLLTLLTMLCGSVMAQEEKSAFWDATVEAALPTELGNDITLTWLEAGGVQAPSYNSADKVVSFKKANKLTVTGTADDVTISEIVFIFHKSDNPGLSVNVGSNSNDYNTPSTTWTGSAKSITFTASGTKRIKSIEVTYTGGSATPVEKKAVLAITKVDNFNTTYDMDGTENKTLVAYYSNTGNGNATNAKLTLYVGGAENKVVEVGTIAAGSTTGWKNITYDLTKIEAGEHQVYISLTADDVEAVNSETKTVTFTKGSTGNKAYTATWTPVTYTISYNLDGGTAADGSPTTYTIESDPVTLLAPTKVGHIFAGWTGTDVAAATLSVTIPTGSTGNRSYTATWEKATFTVTIEGDAQADNTQPKYGDNVTITIAKDEDRTLTALTVDGVNVISGIDEDADSYTYVIRNISADVIVVATFVSTKEFITMDDTYATFSCTQALDFSGVSGLKAYIASGYSKNSGDVLLTRVESVPANTGLILVSTEKGVTYKVPYADSDAYYVNLLKAVDETKTIPQEEGGNVNFLLERRNNSFGFYKSEGNTTLAAGKAYLQVPSSAISSDVKSLRISFGDILVPVQGLKAGAEAPDGVYDLNGRKIPAGHKLTRGVYIVNGKKIAIK